ncbi:MAG: copper-binding protein [Pelomonas sp.]|nr:copper-binding protein [Roseateles sp.]
MKLSLHKHGIALLVALASTSLHATSPAAPTPTEMTAAEVRKIDRDAKKITLKHEAIKHLDMPAMTMVFQVKEDKLLDAAKPGDKVRVGVEKVKGGYAVTAIEVVK